MIDSIALVRWCWDVQLPYGFVYWGFYLRCTITNGHEFLAPVEICAAAARQR